MEKNEVFELFGNYKFESICFEGPKNSHVSTIIA